MSQITLAISSKAEPASAASRSGANFFGHAKLIGGLTLVSRLMGLGREIVAGHYLGTGLVASAFTVAFTIPNLFRKLFGEGALSAAFIPLYSQALKKEQDAADVPSPGTSGEGRGEGLLFDERKGPHPNPLPEYREREPERTFPAQLQPRNAGPSADSSNAFAAAAVNMLCAILLTITILGEILLIAIILRSHHMRPERILLVKLVAIMLPYVMLICGGAFLSGILQVHHRFGPPAAAPIILNVVLIIVLLIGARVLHLSSTTPPNLAIVLETKLSYWIAGFVLVAGALQVSILLPALRDVGFRFQPILHFWTPAIRRMLWLSAPVALGAGVLQLSVLLDKGISLALMQGVDQSGHAITHFHFFGHWVRFPMAMGAPRRLDLAQFLYQFPLGIFAIALATAIFPHLGREALEKNRDRFRAILRQGIEAALWEGLPASVGLVLVRMPAIQLLFQHGQVRLEDSRLIASSLFYYAMAIWAFSVLQIINRAYYAIHDTFTPLMMAIFNILVNLIVEIPLVWKLGESGMAVGTLVSFVLQTLIMLFMLDRKIGGLNLRQSAAPVGKMLLATAAMGAACIGMQHLPFFPHGAGRISWAAQLVAVMSVGAGVYLGVCSLLGLDMIGELRAHKRSVAK